MTSNKKLSISSGVIGVTVALAHIALAIGLIIYMVINKGVINLEDMGIAAIAVAIFAAIAIVIAIAAVIVSLFMGLFFFSSSLVTLFAKKDKARRVFAIINCVFLAMEILVEVIVFFTSIGRAFNGEGFLLVLISAVALAVTVSWFALNIVLAKKPKQIEEI